jgi:hypothetical protein
MKRRLALWISLSMVGLGIGCAQMPELPREEQLAAKTRVYLGVEKEAVIDAARRVLRLQHDDKVRFADRSDGFLATQEAVLFLLVAAEVQTFTWNFRVTEAPGGGVQAEVDAWTAADSFTMAPTSLPGLYSPLSLSDRGAPVRGNVAYKLFWKQLEYMLHRTDDWSTCDDAAGWLRSGEAVGDNRPMCYFMLARRKPGALVPSTPSAGPTYVEAPHRFAIDRKPRP